MDVENADERERGERLTGDASIVADYLDGVSLRDLARRSGLSRQTITRRLQRRGILRTSASSPLPAAPEYWLARFEAGDTVTTLAKEHHRSTMSIYRHLTKIGLSRSAPTPFGQWLASRTETVGDHLIWTGPHTSNGFPLAHREGTVSTAARIVWEHHHGPILAGDDITHIDTCSSRSCVHISHLKLLDHTNRGPTRSARGTSRRGEQHWNAKLNESDVRLILASHQPADQLAANYAVTAHTINEIRAGRRWGWLHS